MYKGTKNVRNLKIYNFSYFVYHLFFRFLIEYIKPKQEGNITKELIKTRELYQSMLRFTRFYQLCDGSYQRDENSTVYSTLMTEGKKNKLEKLVVNLL